MATAMAKKMASKNAIHDADSGASTTGSLPICASVGNADINSKDVTRTRAVT